MRNYIGAKVSEFKDKLQYQQEIIACLLSRGQHQSLVERLEQVCNETEALLRQTEAALAVDVPQLFRRLQVNLVRLRERFELLEEWYLPALLQEGDKEQKAGELISRVLDGLGVPLLSDNVVSFTRALSLFPGIKDHPIFFMPAYTQASLLDWIGLYHEAGHAVYQRFPSIERRLSEEVLAYCHEQLRQTPALTTTQLNERVGRLRQTLLYWNTYRLEELFCDIFGTVVAGLAHLYSWVDVALTSPHSPYLVDMADVHPPNAARTEACMLALDESYAPHPLKIAINTLWGDFANQRPKPPRFRQLCPFPLILRVVPAAQEEIVRIGFQVYKDALPAPPESLAYEHIDNLQELLNIATVNLFFAPQEFSAWQKKITMQLFSLM